MNPMTPPLGRLVLLGDGEFVYRADSPAQRDEWISSLQKCRDALGGNVDPSRLLSALRPERAKVRTGAVR